MKSISVVLIIKDDYKLLECALKSFNDVDYPREMFEVIVVDDGSYEPIKERLNVKVTFDIRFFYLSRTDLSCRSKARNFGAKQAKSQYIMFMDGDHVVEPDVLLKYSRYFEIQRNRRVVLGTRRETPRQHRLMIINSFDRNNQFPAELRNTFERDERLNLLAITGGSIKAFAGRWHLFWSCNFCIEKGLLDETGGFNEEFIGWGFEDVEFGYRLFQLQYEFEILDNYVWHLHPETLKREDTKYASWLKNLLFFYKKYNDIRILEQFEFENIFFYKTGVATETNALDVNWVHSFLNFEKKLRYIDLHPSLFL